MPIVKFQDSTKFTTNHIIFVFVTKVSKIFSDGKPSEKGGDSRKSSESSSKHDAGNKAISNYFVFFIFNIILHTFMNTSFIFLNFRKCTSWRKFRQCWKLCFQMWRKQVFQRCPSCKIYKNYKCQTKNPFAIMEWAFSIVSMMENASWHHC